MTRPIPARGSFAERLDLALRDQGVRKMYALAFDLGVDESAISRWRRGRPISTDNLVKLADRLSVSIDWLLTGRGGMAAPHDGPTPWRQGFRQAVEAASPGCAAHLSAILREMADACQEPTALS